MKIKINDRIIFEIDETKEAIFKDIFFDDEFEEEIERLIVWILEHNMSNIIRDMKSSWLPKAKELGIESIPTDDEKFAALIFARSEYKNRSARDGKNPKKKVNKLEK